jgi:organic hydroperoxide reductase OsmC/OhrA
MQDYPHRYTVSAAALERGVIDVDSPGLETLPTQAPPEFDGPGGLWSPETLLVASVANCLILTFRAVARGSHYDWISLNCSVEGILDRVDRVTRFTEFHIGVTLRVPEGSDEHKARRLVEKSESVCLVTNSLNGAKHLSIEVLFES